MTEEVGLSESIAKQLDLSRRRRVDYLSISDMLLPRRTMARALSGNLDRAVDDHLFLPENVELAMSDLLLRALRSGLPNECSELHVYRRNLAGTIKLHGMLPVSLNVSNFRFSVGIDELFQAFPHDFERLAFECALSGASDGLMIMFYPRVRGERFFAYDVHYGRPERSLTELDRRLATLEANDDSGLLPPCPSWMVKFCRYGSGCLCG